MKTILHSFPRPYVRPFLFLLFFIAGFKVYAQPLTGPYDIGAGLSAPNYPTITAAVNDLNTRGVSGSVIFNLIDTLYSTAETFPIALNTITGSSAINTVTIKPAAGNSVRITGSSSNSIIRLNGSAYVIIDGSNNGTNSRNLTVMNTNTGTSSAVIWMQNTASLDGANHNTLSNMIITGSGNGNTLVGIGAGSSTISNASTGQNNNANIISNCAISALQIGVYMGGRSAALKDQDNVISNNTISSGVKGILVSFENNITIDHNKVTVTNSSTTMGISVGVTSTNTYTPSGNEVTNANVIANTIGSVASSGGTTAFGIAVAAATSGTTTLANNVIFGISSNATPSDFCAGIYLCGGTGSTTRLYFNSVSLTGSATRSTPNAYAVAVASGNPIVEMKNNAFYNIQTTSGTGKSYAIGYASTTFTNLISDYNLFYTSGVNAAFAVTGGIGATGTGTNRSNLAALQTVTSQDANSISVDPVFATNNLLVPDPSSPLIARGVTVPGFTTDIQGTLRNVPPFIGAFESAADLRGPSISYTPLGNDFLPPGSRTLTNFATITDGSGVSNSPGTAPRFYYKKSTDANVFGGNTSADNGWKWVESAGGSSPFSFFVDYSLLFGGTVNTRDVIQYFVVAQDILTPGNISAFPSNGFSGSNMSSITSAPSSPYQYIVVNQPPLSGSYDIGSGLSSPNYPTITAALADLIFLGVSSSVTFNLVDTNYGASETFPLVINAYPNASSTNTVTIKPAAGNNARITGSSSTSILRLDAAAYVIIDGSNNGTNSRNLTVTNTNTSTSSAVIWMQNNASLNGANHNTLSNLIITGSGNGNTLVGIGAGSSTISNTSTGQNNNANKISNCSISALQIGVYMGGRSVPLKDQDNVISNNVISTGIKGILVSFENNITIDHNTVTVTNASTTMGISVGITSTNTYTPSGNEVTNANVIANTIGPVTSSAGTTAFGIAVAPATSGTTTLANNMIFGVSSNATPSDFCAGIYLGGGTGSTTRLYFNSVVLSGSATRTSPNVYAVAVASGDPVIDMKNNIFYNTQATTGIGKTYAVGYGSTTFANLISDYNLFYTSGANAAFAVTGGIGENTAGTDRSNLAALQTATSQDAHSKSLVVNFMSATDLHIAGVSIGDVSLAGTNIPAFTTDYDGETRFTYPYIGADENVASPVPVTLLNFGAKMNGNDVLLNWSTASEINSAGFAVERSFDNKQFNETGFVKSTGNSNSLVKYRYNDNNVSNSGIIFYRLRMVDLDGSFAYSKTVSVNRNETNTGQNTTLYPNPFVKDLSVSITLSAGGKVKCIIMDMAGRTLDMQEQEVEAGTSQLQLNTQSLQTGIYFVTISCNGVNQVHKVIKQ